MTWEEIMYNKMYRDIENILDDTDVVATKTAHFPFRKHSEHIWRVFQWAKRLIDGNTFDVAIDTDSVLIAALFHDVGYALSLDGSQHAENSAIVHRWSLLYLWKRIYWTRPARCL